jgi:hypothetical protein
MESEWLVTWAKGDQQFGVWVKTASGAASKIIDGAPLVKRWIGQSFNRMIVYYGAKYERINKEVIP